MRQLNQGQKLEIWIPQEVDAKHSIAPKGQALLDEAHLRKTLLPFLEKNEEDSSRFKNRMSIQRQMDAQVRSAMIRKTVDLPVIRELELSETLPPPNALKALEKYRLCKQHLKSQAGYNPIAMYRGVGLETHGKHLLEEHRKNLKRQKVQDGQFFTYNEKQTLTARLDAYNWDNVPLLEKDRASNNTGAYAQTLQQVHQETRTEAKTKVEIKLPTEPLPARWSPNLWFKTPQELFSRQFDQLQDRGKLLRAKDKLQRVQAKAIHEKKKDFKARIAKLQSDIASLEKSTENNLVGFTSMSDLLIHFLPPTLKHACKFFSPNFMCTTNFAYEMMALPTGRYSFPLTQLLIVHDESGYKAIAVNAYDTRSIQRLLELDRKQPVAKECKRKIALYDLNLEQIIPGGREAFTAEELSHPELQSLFMQAKVFAGKTDLNSDERAIQMGIANIKSKKPTKPFVMGEAVNLFFHMYQYFLSKADRQSEQYHHQKWIKNLKKITFSFGV